MKVQTAIYLVFALFSLQVSCKTKKVNNTIEPKQYYSKFDSTDSKISKYNYSELDESHKNRFVDTDIIKLSWQYPLGEFMFDELLCGNKDTIYWLNANKITTGQVKDGDTIPLYMFTNGQKTTKYIKYPSNRKVQEGSFNSFEVTDKYFIVKYSHSIVLYDKISLKQKDEIFYDESLQKIKKIGNKIFIYGDIFGLPSSGAVPICCELDPVTFKVKNKYVFDLPKGANMTYRQPKKVFGVWKNGIYISDVTYYHIRFYDFNQNLISEINYEPDNWIKNEEVAKKN